MKLRTKVLLAILMVWSAMFLFFYISTQYLLSDYYLKLEDQLAKDSLKRAVEAIEEKENVVANVASGWSLWDEAFKFVKDQNPVFIEKNLTIPVLANSDVDIALIYGASGNNVFSKALNPERTKEIPVPETLKKALDPGGHLWNLIYQPKADLEVRGLFKTPQGLFLLAIYPILPSNGKGQPDGTWILAKYWTVDTVEKIRNITQLDLIVYDLNQIDKNSELPRVYKALLKNPEFLLEKEGESLFAYKLLSDISNKPTAILKINLPRSVYLTGVHTMQYFFATSLFSTMALALLLFFLLDHLVVLPLEKVNKKFITIQKNQDFSPTLPEKGPLEIASFNHQTNEMLQSIEQYKTENKKLIEDLNQEFKRSQSFSEKLKMTQSKLKDIIDSMPSLLIILNKELRICGLNQMAEKKLEEETKDATGKSLTKFFPYLKPYEQAILNAIQTKHSFSAAKIEHLNTSGETEYKQLLVFPLRHPQEEAVVIRIDNISKQIKIENKILQNEKMVSLGLLTAGVAHEINNPINFILASVSPLQRNIEDLLKILKLYHDIKPDHAAEQLKLIEKLKEELDLNYLLQETQELLKSIQDGVERTVVIIQDLRSFSRLDESSKKKADIQEGIDSTLSLLHHNYKNRIKIIKEYGNIPQIKCYPGKLNQVFMNLLSNAIDAIPDQGEIHIKTEQIDSNHVEIRIRDNGSGINPQNLETIFDPFFTTKPVGSGTGLGLSVSKEIIETHGGKIEVKSRLNEGTEFIIKLPIN